MSVFGGDSWEWEAQHRKRRVDDLMLSTSSLSSKEAPSPSFKKLSNGKYVCLVCPHNPILDTPLVLSMHHKGSRHITAESRMRERELSIKEELNKRKALCSHSFGIPSPGSSMRHKELPQCHDKPLIKQTREAILETRQNKVHQLNGLDFSQNAKLRALSSMLQPKCIWGTFDRVGLEQSTSYDKQYNSEKRSVSPMKKAADKTHWVAELCEHREKELKFTAAGWKRDCHGKWYRDENVEFDSDEEDPNACLI